MVEYVDDPTIFDDSALWRRICPRYFIPDENLGEIRPSSAAFNNDQKGLPMSVYLAEVVVKSGRTAEEVLSQFPGYGMASITAGLVRHCEQGVARDPIPEESSHAAVFGKKNTRIRKMLRNGSKWVIPPADSSGTINSCSGKTPLESG